MKQIINCQLMDCFAIIAFLGLVLCLARQKSTKIAFLPMLEKNAFCLPKDYQLIIIFSVRL